MKGQHLDREILSLAIPSILANITVPLVGLVDIAISGHLGDLSVQEGYSAAALIGGISVGTMLFNLLYWSFGFLRTGTGGLTAQMYGECRRGGGDNMSPCRPILLRALAIAWISAISIIILQWVLLRVGLVFFDSSPEVRTLASKYFYIRIWAAPATLSLFAIKGWFIGMQDTVSPMITDIVVNGLNIILSIFLAFGPLKLGYSGIALGTLLAQWIGLFTGVLLLALKYRKSVFADFRMAEILGLFSDRSEMKSYFMMNGDLLVRSFAMIAIHVGFTAIASRYGDIALSVCSIMLQLMMIFSYFTDGFAYAGEAMTGKYIGLKDSGALSSTVRGVFIWSMGIAVIFVFIYAFSGEWMFRMMTTDSEVLSAAVPFLPWLAILPLFGCPAYTWDGIYTGATATREMAVATVVSSLVFFGLVALGGRLLPMENVHVLLGSYVLHLAVRTAWLTVTSRKAITI